MKMENLSKHYKEIFEYSKKNMRNIENYNAINEITNIVKKHFND